MKIKKISVDNVKIKCENAFYIECDNCKDKLESSYITLLIDKAYTRGWRIEKNENKIFCIKCLENKHFDKIVEDDVNMKVKNPYYLSCAICGRELDGSLSMLEVVTTANSLGWNIIDNEVYCNVCMSNLKKEVKYE